MTMSTPTEEITVDLDAISGATGGEVAERSQVAPDGSRVAPKEPEIEVKTAPEPEKAPKKTETQVLTLDEGLERLKKQVEAERAARIAAENRARAASEAEARAQTRVQSTELDVVKGGIANLTAANDGLEEKYAAALAAQDYAAAAKAQREMSANEAKIAELSRAQANMERAPKPQPRRTSDDPVERVTANMSEKSAAWIRAHPEYARSQAKFNKMLAAHYEAEEEGFVLESPEYFAVVEEKLGVSPQRQNALTVDADATADAAKPSTSRPSRQTAPPSAPVSRSGNGTGATRRNVVTLTAEQVEIAKMMQMTPEEYAKQVVALENEGKISRH